MNIAEMLNNVQFLVDSEGNKKSVMLEYRLWEKLLLFFEDAGRTAVPKQTAKKKTKSFLRTARSLNLDGPADWSKNFEEYLYGDKIKEEKARNIS